MSTTKPDVLEPQSRYIGTAQLYITKDGSWSIGTDTKTLVQVRFGDIARIDDSTFGFSAVAVDKTSSGYRLFVKSDADGATIVEVKVDASGNVDPASVAVLTSAQVYAAENTLAFDLNGNGGLGAEPVVVEGGAVNIYVSAEGIYQVGTDPANLVTLKLGGQGLTDKILPAGWEIVELVPSNVGFEVFAQAPTGEIYDALFNASGEYTGGQLLDATQLAAVETSKGIDINGDSSLAAPAGWTSVIKDAFLKGQLDAALAANGHLTHGQLAALMGAVIQEHKTAGNTPISSIELADLQALAGRGKALFTGGTNAHPNAAEYLSFAFSKIVEGSPANSFYTGGQAKAADLGNLAANSPLATLEKLVDKWLLGGDLPTPTAGGDPATGKASTTTGVYAQASGNLIVEGATPADIKQGLSGNCYFVAALVAIADVNPAAITSMIVDNGVVNGSHTWGVRFYDAAGQANWVTVNDKLPVADAGGTTLIFGSSGTAGNNVANTELWVPLLEKAYAQANTLKFLPTAEKVGVNSYWAVEGGQGDPIAQILGGKVTAYSFVQGSNFGDNKFITAEYVNRNDATALAAFEKLFIAALNGGKAIWIGADNPTSDSFGNKLLVGSHAFAGIDADKSNPNNSTIAIWNPWGVSALPVPPGPVEGGGHLSPFATYDLITLIGIPGIDIMIGG